MKRARIPLFPIFAWMLLMPLSVAAQDATVQTASGPVRGTVASDLTVFKGIPYAATPVDELRWMPPAPAAPWTEVRDATKFGPAAPQTPDEIELKPGTPTSEDCLTLNVWTPAADDAGRPVLVWIHGGAFSWGTARNDLYDGSQFARHGDVVVVTIQYRLGPFGWLHLKNVSGKDYATSGNNGLLDQIAALQRVQDNIAKFGGDPNNVTVAGESAGGISIGAMMASPNAQGLFQKAILQSGSPGLVMTADGARSLIDSTKANDYQAFADQTQNAWIAFMRSGDPNHDSLPAWSRYDLTERATMSFDIDPVAELDPLFEQREAWGDIAFDGMHPKLENSTPTTFAGTRITPAIVIAMIGPTWTAAIAVGLSVLLGGSVMLVRRLQSHRTNQPANAT